MVVLTTVAIHIALCHTLSLGFLVPQHYQFLITLFTLFLFCLAFSCFCLIHLINSNSLSSLIWSKTTFHALWDCPFWALISISLLVASSMSLSVVNSPNISPIVTSLSSPCMNCSTGFNHTHGNYSLILLCTVCPSIPRQIHSSSFWACNIGVGTLFI